MTISQTQKNNQPDIDIELSRLRDLETVINTTERLAQIGHYEWNKTKGCMESCSVEYARIFDMTVAQVLESQNSLQGALKYIHPDDIERYTRTIEAMPEYESLDVQFRILIENNTIKHVREVSISTNDPDREGRFSFGILQDITEQVKRELDLKYRDDMAHQAESMTDIGHFIFDWRSENYTYLSEGYARIHGSTVDGYMGKVQSREDDLADIHPDDRRRVEDEYNYYLKTAEECAIEYRIIRSNGQVRWVRELGKAQLVEDGKVLQTLGVLQDITEQVSREQELMFKATIASEVEKIADIGYCLFDEKNDRHIFTSPGLARIVGLDIDTYNEKIITRNDFIGLVYEEDQALVIKAYEQDIYDYGQWKIEYRILKPDGELVWILEVGKAFKRSATGVDQSVGLVRDITNQKKIEQELLYKDALANQAETITDIGHFVYDELKETYLFISPGLADIYGVTEVELVSSLTSRDKDLGRVHADDQDQVAKAYDSFFINNDKWQVEYRLVRANGDIRWVREMGKAHLMNHGIVEQTVGVLQDITEQKYTEQELLRSKSTLEQQVVERTKELSNTVKQLQEQIEERKKVEAELDFLANHDALTGLPSLRLCKDRLERSLAAARRNTQMTAVMFLDLDGFKKINDTLGHESGDQVLIKAAKRIQLEIRETDTVARIGGDEFIIILSNLSEIPAVKNIASNLIKQISQPFIIDQKDVSISASIGIALYPEHGVTSDQLMRAADKAMYDVKKSGKNNFGIANTTEPKTNLPEEISANSG